MWLLKLFSLTISTAIIFLSVTNTLFAAKGLSAFGDVSGNLSGNKAEGNSVYKKEIHNHYYGGKLPARNSSSYSERDSRDSAREHTDKGYKLARSGSHSPAIQHYKKALEIDPDFSPAYYAWGYSLVSLGRNQEAIEKLSNAIVNEEHPDAFYQLGKAQVGVGDYKQALINFSTAIEKSEGQKHEAARSDRVALYRKLERQTPNENYIIDAKPDLKIMRFPYYGDGSSRFTKTTLLNNSRIKLILPNVSQKVEIDKGVYGRYALIKFGDQYGYAQFPYLKKYTPQKMVSRNSQQKTVKAQSQLVKNKVITNTPQTKLQQAQHGRNYTIQLASFDTLGNAKKALNEYKKVGAYIFRDRKSGRNVIAVGRFVNATAAKQKIPTLKVKLNMRNASFFPKKVQ